MCRVFPSDISTKALITFPNICNDLFILHPSLSLSPYTLAYFYLSDPARSTKLNFEYLTCVTPLLFF